MKQGKIKKMKVVRIDENEYELEDGRVYEHVVRLDHVPSLEEFQKIYDEQVDNMNRLLEEADEDE